MIFNRPGDQFGLFFSGKFWNVGIKIVKIFFSRIMKSPSRTFVVPKFLNILRFRCPSTGHNLFSSKISNILWRGGSKFWVLLYMEFYCSYGYWVYIDLIQRSRPLSPVELFKHRSDPFLSRDHPHLWRQIIVKFPGAFLLKQAMTTWRLKADFRQPLLDHFFCYSTWW